jgi:hypothetical protein
MPARDHPISSPRPFRIGSPTAPQSPQGVPWASFSSRMLSSTPSHPGNVPTSSVIISEDNPVSHPTSNQEISTSYRLPFSLLVYLLTPVFLDFLIYLIRFGLPRRNVEISADPIKHIRVRSQTLQTTSGIEQFYFHHFQWALHTFPQRHPKTTCQHRLCLFTNSPLLPPQSLPRKGKQNLHLLPSLLSK